MSFAPAAPLARAASKLRSSLDHSRDRIAGDLHTAEELYAEAQRTEEDAEQAGEELPEELNPREAEEIIAEEYRPLMEDGDAEEGRGRSKRSQKGGAQGGKVKVRKLEVWIAYLAFFILGAAILLGWNQIIVASSYFAARLEGSPFESSFASFVSLTFTTANLIFLGYANVTQGSANLSRRISWSIIVMTVNLILFIITTRIEEIPATLFFAFLIVSAIVLAASASLLQNGVVALSSSFGPSYLNQIMSGQGAIGFAVALLQFVAAYGAAKNAKNSPAPTLLLQAESSPVQLLTAPPDSVRTSAFIFFLTIGIFAGVSWFAYAVLIHLPLYRLVIRANSEDGNETSSIKSVSPTNNSLKVVERKVRHLGVAMFICFGITLSVFPAVTATVQSIKEGEPNARLIQSAALFVPLGFAVFAGGDWMGRILPQIEKLVWTNWKALMGCSVARIAFIPLFLICNQTAGTSTPLINSDLLFFLIMFVFAISNGYLSTLIMLAAVAEPSLEDEEVEVAATCLAFYLTLGLASGSFLSFGVLALARHFM